MLSRRAFGLGLIAAPAIVRASSLMHIRALPLPPGHYIIAIEDARAYWLSGKTMQFPL